MIYVVFATKALILKTPFPKYKYIIETPDIEVSMVYNDFEMNLFYPKTFYENPFWWDYEPPKFWLKIFCYENWK